MHEERAPRGEGERAAAQPFHQLGAVGRVEDVLHGIVVVQRAHASGHREQVQVVVTEQDHRALAKVAHQAQRVQRPQPAVDQVAEEHQRFIGGDPPQQRSQRIEATLQIADRPHGRRSSRSTRPERRRHLSDPGVCDCSTLIA